MLKALIKKQLTETISIFIKNKTAGKKQKLALTALFIFLFLYLGVAVFFMTKELAEICAFIDYGWLYFSLIGAVSSLFGAVGSIFTAYAAMFDAKDNDLLLSMPIPPRLVLCVRMLGVYAMSFLFGSILYVPATVAYFYVAGFDAWLLLCGALICIFMPLISTALACLLGWLIALLLSKIKRKNLVTVVFSLVFIGLYYWGFSYLPEYITNFAEKAEGVADLTKSYLYPFYSMGMAAMGNALQLLLFVAICVALIGAVYLPLSYGFLKLSTTKTGGAGQGYVSRKHRAKSADTALLSKELARFTGSATYMLNSALGGVMSLVAAVFALVKADLLGELTALFPFFKESGVAALLASAVVCFATGMNTVSACSINLEGGSLGILKSLPVDGGKILKAKLNMHLLVSLPFALLASVLFCLALGADPIDYVISLVICSLFVLFCSMAGLLINLKFPNLDWKNETVAVKQSLSPLLAMLLGFVTVITLGAGCGVLMFKGYVNALPLGIACIAALAVLDLLLYRLLKGYGVKRFASL